MLNNFNINPLAHFVIITKKNQKQYSKFQLKSHKILFKFRYDKTKRTTNDNQIYDMRNDSIVTKKKKTDTQQNQEISYLILT